MNRYFPMESKKLKKIAFSEIRKKNIFLRRNDSSIEKITSKQSGHRKMEDNNKTILETIPLLGSAEITHTENSRRQ